MINLFAIRYGAANNNVLNLICIELQGKYANKDNYDIDDV